MGFIKEVYSNNRAGLVVAFGRGKTSANYFSGDNIQEAMKHFNIYLKGNEMYIRSQDEVAINNLGINVEDAAEFRSTIDAIIVTLSDEQAISSSVLFPVWQAETTYTVGERVRYNNKLYKVLQDHDSQMGWEPLYAPSLFAALLIDEENNTILAWVQPDSTNGYKKGDKVIHNELFWVSSMDNNVWEPGLTNSPWTEYIADWENGVVYTLNQKVMYENTIYISLSENNLAVPSESDNWKIFEIETDEDGPGPGASEEPEVSEPEIEPEVISAWVPADDGGLYMKGDKVIFEEEIYESVIDNNVWSPIEYPLGWTKIEG